MIRKIRKIVSHFQSDNVLLNYHSPLKTQGVGQRIVLPDNHQCHIRVFGSILCCKTHLRSIWSFHGSRHIDYVNFSLWLVNLSLFFPAHTQSLSKSQRRRSYNMGTDIRVCTVHFGLPPAGLNYFLHFQAVRTSACLRWDSLSQYHLEHQPPGGCPKHFQIGRAHV